MTAGDVLRFLREDRMFIIGIVTLTVVGAVIAGRLVPDDVSASAQAVVYSDSRSATLLGHTQAAAKTDYDVMVGTHTRLATTPEMASRVIARLNLQDTPQALLERVSVSAMGRSDVLSFSAEDPDPATAMAIADTLLAEYIAWSEETLASDIASATASLGTRITAAETRLAELEARLKTQGHTKELDTAIAAAAADYEQLLADRSQLELLAQVETPPIAIVSNAVAEEQSTVMSVAVDILKGLAAGLVLAFLIAVPRFRLAAATRSD